jgi:hypothetical protein
MKQFTSDDSRNDQGWGLIRARSNGEEEELLDLSFQGVAGARTFSRRQALGLLGGSLAGASLLSVGLANPAKSQGVPFSVGDVITLRSLWVGTGPRYLDGRTHNNSVGLAPHTNPPFTGTRWEVYAGKTANQISLYCKGTAAGNRWLDGLTAEGAVQLAPTRAGVFSGTYWQADLVSGKTDEITLKCLGTGAEGNRYLIGRGDGSVGLAPQGGQVPGTRWRVVVSNQ